MAFGGYEVGRTYNRRRDIPAGSEASSKVGYARRKATRS
jgi:hypothetical protein